MKLKTLLIIIIFLINILSSWGESKPIVQIDPIINMSEEVWLDALCIKTADSVSLTLKLLGQFIVSTEIPTKIGDINTEALRIRSEAEGYDNIIFGSCSFIDGSYIISMNAYDRALNKITYSDSTTVESIFDTLDAIDQIIDKTVEGFSGIHVTYGSLALLKPESGEPLSFTIDDVALAEGSLTIDKMPSGKHKLTIIQDRYFGKHIVESDIFIQENIVNKIPFPVARVTTEEAAILNIADKKFTNDAIIGNTKTILTPELENLLSSNFYVLYRPKVIQKYENWTSLISDNIDYSKPNEIVRLNKKISSVWRDELPKSVVNKNVSLTSRYEPKIDKKQYKLLNKLVPDYKTITIDGKADDWANVTSGYIDPVGDVETTNISSNITADLTEFKIAFDTKHLYILIGLKEKVEANDDIRYGLSMHADGKISFNLQDYNKKFEISTNTENNGGTDIQWVSLEQQVRYKLGDVLEFSIPLKMLMKSTRFDPEMTSYLNIYYSPRNAEEDYEIDGLSKAPIITFPMLEILTRKEN
ncbi:MAG: hypothetical protein OCD02_17925 [Spirochaetaceae bacterium]